ncbi:MAG: thiamine-phosphate kinase [bacterium]|nr:thiamine-phosphate kinase [bacterium]
MRLSELGEFGLIRRLQEACAAANDRVILGIGDDAAVIRCGEDGRLVLTTDAMVEGVHFERAWYPPDSLGWKCLAVNLSDVAAMGASPICCVVTAALPESWSVEETEALYAGLKRCADRYRCPVVGGDTVRSTAGAVFSVAVLGEMTGTSEIRRSGAAAGDRICVTGVLGGAAVGLNVLCSGGKDRDRFSESVRRLLEPLPRAETGVRLARSGGVTSMIDISDGLTSELRHLCEASGLGCLLYADRVPVSAETASWAAESGKSPVGLALESGEEYELLFTVNPSVRIDTAGPGFIGPEDTVTVIGEMRPPEDGMRIREGGVDSTLRVRGWDHYRSASGNS